MTYYEIKPAIDTLKTYIEANYETYLALIRTASGFRELPKIAKVNVGNDYNEKGRVKPFILIDPVNATIDDEGIGCMETVINIDVLFACEGATPEIITEYTECYADAFVSMVLSNDTLGDGVQHISVRDIAYYPGGTGTVKYVLLNVEVTVETDRS